MNRFLQEFFASYPGVEYDSSKSATGEFRRLCKMFRWDIDSRNHWQAREAFQIALVKRAQRNIWNHWQRARSWILSCNVVFCIASVPVSVDDWDSNIHFL